MARTNDWTYSEAMDEARRRHGAYVVDSMDVMIAAGEQMQAAVVASGIALDDIAIPMIPYAPGEAEALANAVIAAEERRRPLARVRRWLRRVFG